MNQGSSELPAAGHSAEVFIQGPAGRLETLVAMPKEDLRGFCVVCHPHPLFGGAMTNKVVYTLASCALKAGFATARFNFRGVGKSTGLYDETRGETDDALAVVAWLRAQLDPVLAASAQAGPLPLTLAGFSFGAYVALNAAAQARPQRLVSIAIPFGRYVNSSAPPPHPGCPWLAVHSHDDDVVDFASTQAALAAYAPPPRLQEFDGAGHFFNGRLTELQDVVLPFLR
ncbi:MAG: hypothetical protein JWR16_1782 [Nevskia sp.]|nr:hypothetical protein [Nevskia sp.]